MNKADFEHLIEECRSRLAEGESIESILQIYPDQAGQLEPLLQAAQAAMYIPKPDYSKAAFQEGKNRLLAEADHLRLEGHFDKSGTKSGFLRYSEQWKNFIGSLFVPKEKTEMKLASRLALYLLITVVVAGFFTVNASASSLPGDPLYDFKLGWEQARLALTFNPDVRAELEMEYESERRSEVEVLLSQGLSAEVEFYGTIESKETDTWTISGIAVRVGPDTELKGNLELGTPVKVHALSQSDGSLLAREIEADLEGSEDDDLIDDSSDDLEDESEDEIEDDSDDDLDDDSSDDEIDDDSSDDDLDDDSSDDDLDDDSSDDEINDDSSDDDLDDDSSDDGDEKDEDEKEDKDDEKDDDDDKEDD